MGWLKKFGGIGGRRGLLVLGGGGCAKKLYEIDLPRWVGGGTPMNSPLFHVLCPTIADELEMNLRRNFIYFFEMCRCMV